MKSFTEIIDKYLNNELTETERKTFEEELSKNPELQKQVELHKEIIEGIKTSGLKSEIKDGFKKAKTGKLIKNLIIGTAVATLVAVGAYYVKTKLMPTEGTATENKVLYELNELGENNWSDADKHLESQIFKINARKDTIIETKNGIVFQVKAGTFLDKLGEVPENPIDFEVKEAMTAYDIIKAGLFTKSDDELLETGGMFYFNARTGKEVLTMDQGKPIKTAVPYGGKKHMSLYDGERKKDGTINWINPKRMKKIIPTVDILSLNFYPGGFLDSLKSMGFNIKNKKRTDSVYYSFSNYSTCDFEGNDEFVSGDSAKSAETPTAVSVINQWSIDGNTVITSSNVILANSATNNRPILNGETLFRMNCSTCHSANTDKKLTGPGLKGVMNRVPKGDWMKKWILNNEKVIKSGDAYANKIFNENGKATMSVFEGQLTERDVDEIIAYLSQKPSTAVTIPSDSSSGCIAEINPSRIRAIWDGKFNNTILATKAFEERLKVIFQTCNPSILDLYIKNLDKELFAIDSAAAMIGSNPLSSVFLDFSRRMDGGVNISDERELQLQNYFKAKKEVYDKAEKEAREKMYTDEFKKQVEAMDKKSAYYNEFERKQSGLLEEEIEKNIDETYRQLGRSRPPGKPVGTYITAEMITPGWKNCDLPVPLDVVTEGTMARATISATTVGTKQQVLIEYKEAGVMVKDRKSYDRLLCYLLPDKLSSFQLMKFDGTNSFKEKINMTFKNSIITVGYKGDKVYYNEIPLAEGQTYDVDLKEIKVATLTAKLNSKYPFAAT
ncbi:MAG: hypothetical protein K0S32_2591, partial [Bacteroidetes bacterium]|nr:hypothetical protein [Bacteroidota bacterium]